MPIQPRKVSANLDQFLSSLSEDIDIELGGADESTALVDLIHRLQSTVKVLKRKIVYLRTRPQDEVEHMLKAIKNNLTSRELTEAYGYACQVYDVDFFTNERDPQFKLKVATMLADYFLGKDTQLWTKISQQSNEVQAIIYGEDL